MHFKALQRKDTKSFNDVVRKRSISVRLSIWRIGVIQILNISQLKKIIVKD